MCRYIKQIHIMTIRFRSDSPVSFMGSQVSKKQKIFQLDLAFKSEADSEAFLKTAQKIQLHTNTFTNKLLYSLSQEPDDQTLSPSHCYRVTTKLDDIEEMLICLFEDYPMLAPQLKSSLA